MLNDKQERAAFEAWLNPGGHVVGVSGDDDAALDLVHGLAWLAWKARAALAAVPQVPADTAIQQLQEQKDGAYLERNRCVAALARMAIALGQRAGRAKTAIDGWDPAWHGCIYIDLPTGQVSWHYHESQSGLFNDLPEYAGRWDGHDTPTKYERLAAAFPVLAAAPVPAVPPWRPIETAPKDCSDVLLLWGGAPVIGSYNSFAAQDRPDGMAWFAERGLFNPGPKGNHPTHWMPLPAAPGAGWREGSSHE